LITNFLFCQSGGRVDQTGKIRFHQGRPLSDFKPLDQVTGNPLATWIMHLGEYGNFPDLVHFSILLSYK
jgi:hypothetical protein